jgi:AcrR family transcriptional regulator
MATSHGDLPIWSRPEPGSRRPRFTRQQIAEVALRIADRDGFQAVSMRRVAAELGAATMSLYHYVRTKDDLIALMDDALMAEALVPDQDLPAHWRAALTAIARRTRAALIRHSWALSSLQGAQLGPNAMRHFEQSLAAAAGTGLDVGAKFELLALVDAYVFGNALQTAEARKRAAEAQASPEAVTAALEYGLAQLRTGRFPHIAALLDGAEPDAAAVAGSGSMPSVELLDDQFERGLQAVLDGAAARWGIPRTAGAAQGRE